jgi:hypothetical protein
LNRFDIESDEQCEQWLLPETIAIGSRSIQSEHKAVSNYFIFLVQMIPTVLKMYWRKRSIGANELWRK